jgi:hypothetical protein
VTDYEEKFQGAVISAYYSRLVSRGDTLRGRAQGAYATMSTLAGGLIGVGLLANLSQLSFLARILGLLTTGVWVLAAAGFVLAATTSVKAGNLGSDFGEAFDDRQPDPETTAADNLLDQVRDEQRHVRRRVTVALVIGTFAAAATIVTLIVAVVQFPSNSGRGVVQLTPAGVDLLVTQCETLGANEAVVDVRGITSTSTFLDVVIAEGPAQGCRVLLPRTSVIGLKIG